MQTISNGNFFKQLTPENKRYLFSNYYAFMVSGMMVTVISAVQPFLKEEYQLGLGTAGALLSFHSAGALVASYLAGIISLSIGRKKMSILLSSSIPLSIIILLFFKQPAMLMLAFFLTGFGRGSIANFANTAINQIAVGNSLAMNLLHGIFSIGAFTAPFLFVAFTTNDHSLWRYPLVVIALFGVILLIALSRVHIHSDAPQKTAKNHDYLRSKLFWISTLMLFCYSCGETSINGWLVTYFVENGILSVGFSQVMASLLWLVILAGRLLCGYLSTRISRRVLLLSMATGYCIFFTFMLITRQPLPVSLSVAGLGFFMAGLYPTIVSNIGTVMQTSPLALSSMLTLVGIGQVASPAITGAIAEKTGILGGMAAISVPVAGCLVFAIINAACNFDSSKEESR